MIFSPVKLVQLLFEEEGIKMGAPLGKLSKMIKNKEIENILHFFTFPHSVEKLEETSQPDENRKSLESTHKRHYSFYNAINFT